MRAMETLSSKLMTPQQVMEYLQISKPTFFRYIKSGYLKSHKVGGNIRVPIESIQELLKAV